MVLSKNKKTSRYTASQGYQVMQSSVDGDPSQGYQVMQSSVDGDPSWWWTKIWKVRLSNKMKIFMWLALENKVLTWEMLQTDRIPTSIFSARRI